MSGGEVFDISGHMDRLHVLQPGNPLPFAPAQKHGSGASIGRPRVAVTDIDREEFEEAAGAALPCPGDQRRQSPRRVSPDAQFTHPATLTGFGG
jgi:hypothetical protein